jgi:predicted ATPase
MIDRIEFQNFKVLREAKIQLRPFNLIVGPNGSGKSTCFQALEAVRSPGNYQFDRLASVGASAIETCVTIAVNLIEGAVIGKTCWQKNGPRREVKPEGAFNGQPEKSFNDFLKSLGFFSFEPAKIGEPVQLVPNAELTREGANLAAALDNLRDLDDEAFQALREELSRWLPEFNSIRFSTPRQGQRSFGLRTKTGNHTIPAKDLSEGTLVALALLTLAYRPNPPSVICVEEPDRHLHPRLLRDVRDALYRLAYPDQHGLKRKPVQVIATTHSPYFLDLFKERPDEIVIAEKLPDGSAQFKPLADEPHLFDIIGEASLGEIWYSGILGGVPALKP